MSFAIRFVIVTLFACGATTSSARDLKLLFLGDRGHHRPAERFQQLQPVLKERGIALDYTENAGDLNKAKLAEYAGLVIYANIDEITPEQETALLEYVAGGGGLVPLHCASFCFRNSPKYVDLVGAQFQKHGTGTVRTKLAQPDHEILRGFAGFESWDETYVHTKHNEANRVVLETRDENGKPEPWTWTRTHGRGRVFYTAWGHDERTWDHAGFQNLVERGIRWACGDDPQLAGPYSDLASYRPTITAARTDVKPFEYVEAKVPFYPAGGPRKGDGAWNKMQLPLSPEESLKHYVHPDDFELRLFAAEPDIGKSLAMTWDARGRLWLCESTDYPNNLAEAGQGRDRIRICEDTDGDGRADKFTVFAEGLSIPTTLAFHRGGVIVQNGTETLYLRDTNGDDRADVRKVLLTGWGAGDTHGGVSNFRYGLDNWYWAMQGYNNSTPTRPASDKHPAKEFATFRMGFFRFRLSNDDDPIVTDLEFIRSTNNNTWGLGFSEEGHVFGSTANGNPSEYMPIPNRYYEAVRGWSAPTLGGIAADNHFEPVTENVRQVDHHGGFTAASGHALYTARNYPQAYWNRTAFVCEPTGHLVATFVIEPHGAGFRSRYGWNLVASDDEWAAPIMAEVGPDGNVWVLDWYNYIVQHNPTPVGFQTGKGNAYETELRDKRHARVFRVVPKEFKEAKSVVLTAADSKQLDLELQSSNMFWRLEALRLHAERDGVSSGYSTSNSDDVTTTKSLTARQLCERLLRVADAPSSTVVPNLLKQAWFDYRLATDRILLDATIAATAKHDRASLGLVTAQNSGAAVPHLTECFSRVAEHYARGNPGSEIGQLLTQFSQSQSPYLPAVVDGFARGWPKEATFALDSTAEEALVNLFAKLPRNGQGRLVSLAERMGSKRMAEFGVEITAALLAEAADAKLDEAKRLAAARQAVEFRKADEAVVAKILNLLTPRTSPELAGGLLQALAASEVEAVGRLTVAKLGAITPAARTAAVRLLLVRETWTPALLNALEKGTVGVAELSLDQKQALASHPNNMLRNRAKKLLAAGGGLPNPDRQRVLDDLHPLTERKGDVAAGKLVFTKNCAKCHMHSGEGQKIGPDLTGMAVHPKHELLVHLIDPNRSVEGNFRVYTVVTDDGLVLTGLLAGESKTAIELVDAEAKRHVVQRDNIDELTATAKSLMPEGFEKQVTPDDLTNLLEFLTARGKYFALDLRKAATAVSVRGMFYSEDSTVERLVFPDWSPKTFAGVPFTLVDPQGGRTPNVVLLNSVNGKLPPTMPAAVRLPVNSPVKALHLLGGVSGWGFNGNKSTPETTSMIVRLHYADGETEDHPLVNGRHFADYIRRIDVPESQFAYDLHGRQVRYLAVRSKRAGIVKEVEFVKGPDRTAPIVVAATVETE
jgi:putative membrane-bound dehydrogenase-like protein